MKQRQLVGTFNSKSVSISLLILTPGAIGLRGKGPTNKLHSVLNLLRWHVLVSFLFCSGLPTSRRDVLPAEPAAVPAPSQVPLPQVPPKEPSTRSSSNLFRLRPQLRGRLLPGHPQAPQVPLLAAPELGLLWWWQWSAVWVLLLWPGIWGCCWPGSWD